MLIICLESKKRQKNNIAVRPNGHIRRPFSLVVRCLNIFQPVNDFLDMLKSMVVLKNRNI